MAYDLTYSSIFKIKWNDLNVDIRRTIHPQLTYFLSNYKKIGINSLILKNNKSYIGKFSCSWSTLDPNSDEYKYAYDNDLWHYHIGAPIYEEKEFYKTSDYVMHFIWCAANPNAIKIISIDPHYINKVFSTPKQEDLE